MINLMLINLIYIYIYIYCSKNYGAVTGNIPLVDFLVTYVHVHNVGPLVVLYVERKRCSWGTYLL